MLSFDRRLPGFVLTISPPFGSSTGAGGDRPGIAITTRTFVNDGARTMASGQPTMLFGQVFKDGDICNGDAPQFFDGSTLQPFSAR